MRDLVKPIVPMTASVALSPTDLGRGYCRCGQPINLGGKQMDFLYCFGCAKSETDCDCAPFEETPHDFGPNLWSPIEACVTCGFDTMHICNRCDVHVCTSDDCREMHRRNWFDRTRAATTVIGTTGKP